MRQSKKTILVFVAMLFAGPAILMAAGREFQLQLDCAANASPGHSMSYTIGFDNNDFEQAYKVNYKSRLNGPNQWSMSIGSDGLILGAGQTVNIEQKLGLPRSLKAGKYSIEMKAANDTITTFDSCEFEVK